MQKKSAKKLGWKPEHTFETGIRQTIKWNQNNDAWLQTVTQEEKSPELVASAPSTAGKYKVVVFQTSGNS